MDNQTEIYKGDGFQQNLLRVACINFLTIALLESNYFLTVANFFH